MAERAHPSDPGFEKKWCFRMRRGVVPWIYRSTSPYRLAFEERYRDASSMAEGLDVLDVPCGMGWGTSFLKQSKSLVGLDIDQQSIAEAQKRYGHIASFEVGSMSKLPISDKALDLIVCLEGIEHVPSDVALSFLKESSRVLRNNGKLFISSPFRRDGKHSGNPFHIKEYQPQELFDILDPLFSIESHWEKNVSDLCVLYAVCVKR